MGRSEETLVVAALNTERQTERKANRQRKTQLLIGSLLVVTGPMTLWCCNC